eukprot:GHUV01026441.1.p1 GENE.GHUV01026441.1~~GHUV01026441.1.p1  ORF type:complete len:143 (+),score=17.47 GHUV01026441.1:439-867(+)
MYDITLAHHQTDKSLAMFSLLCAPSTLSLVRSCFPVNYPAVHQCHLTTTPTATSTAAVIACIQAFPFSARHGLEWYELDLTYCFICFLQAIGLAWDVQVPTEKQKAAKKKVQPVKPAKKSTTETAINALDSRNMAMMLIRLN